jgi:hypothetical protein
MTEAVASPEVDDARRVAAALRAVDDGWAMLLVPEDDIGHPVDYLDTATTDKAKLAAELEKNPDMVPHIRADRTPDGRRIVWFKARDDDEADAADYFTRSVGALPTLKIEMPVGQLMAPLHWPGTFEYRARNGIIYRGYTAEKPPPEVRTALDGPRTIADGVWTCPLGCLPAPGVGLSPYDDGPYGEASGTLAPLPELHAALIYGRTIHEPENDTDPGGEVNQACRTATALKVHNAAETERVKIEAEPGPVPLAGLLEGNPEPVQEIIPGYIEKGIPTFLDGPGGSNKSRLALQWSLCIGAGAPVFGHAVEQCHPVYLSSEDDANELTRRAQAIATRLEMPAPVVGTYWDRKDHDSALVSVKEGGEMRTTSFYHRLVEQLLATPGHKFVVLDSIYDFVQYLGNAKIDEGAINAFVKKFLGKLCTDTDSTLLVIRHPSQAGTERGDMSGWSVANHNSPRARLSLAPDKDGQDAYALKVEKRNHGPKGEPLALYYSEGAMLPRSELQVNESRNLLYAAVVNMARAAVDAGDPFKKQANIRPWQLDELQKRIGYRPTSRDVKDELSRAALSIGSLIYVNGDNRRVSGYYPAENAEERSRQLRKGGGKPGGKPPENRVGKLPENPRKKGGSENPHTP